MKKKTLLMATQLTTMLLLTLSLAGLALAFTGRASASDGEAQAPEENEVPATLAGIDISFKMDPRLTRGVHMGDRWLSPPTYSINASGSTATIDARVHGVDATGKRVDVEPTWTPADPEMVTVAPTVGSEVTITVRQAGESRLKVSAGGVSRELTVIAMLKDRAIQVEIVQVPVAGTPEAAERAKILGGPTERTSYALGLDLGRRLKQQPVDVAPDLVAQGLRDALVGDKTLLTEDELKAALLAYKSQLQAERMKDQQEQVAERRKELAQSRSELAEKNKTEGEAFLAENKTKEGVVALESGLQYKVLTAGDGPKPTADDTVVCHYRGTLLDDTEFDSSHKRQKPGTFALKRTIQGWREALQLMPAGSKWQLFIPPELAYGVRGTRKIPPNTTLVFEVELISIKGTSDVSARQPKETDSTNRNITGNHRSLPSGSTAFRRSGFVTRVARTLYS